MIDEVWASLQEESRQVSEEVKKKKKTVSKSAVSLEKPASKQSGDVITLLASMGIAPPMKKTKKSEKKASASEATQVQPSAADGELSPASAAMESAAASTGASTEESLPTATASAVYARIVRDLNVLNEESSAPLRKKALINIRNSVFQNVRMAPVEISDLFRDIVKPLCKRFSDSNEGVREEAHATIQLFFGATEDLVSVLGYVFPVLVSRIPDGAFFDAELQLFVSDPEQHEAYKRGRAVLRQDKLLHSSPVEPSEQVRRLQVLTMHTLLTRAAQLQASAVLLPYAHDMVLFLHAHLHDVCSEVVAAACALMSDMAAVIELESACKAFSIALVRTILPLLRHKHSRIKIAALSTLSALYRVRDVNKRRSAAADTIVELLGFREENVLPVREFYESGVTINFLAEVVQQGSVQVKMAVLGLLSVLMTTIEDRRDHEARLLPYLLDLLADEVPAVQRGAWELLLCCGRQYEEDHVDEVLQHKQYALSGPDYLHFSPRNQQFYVAPFDSLGRPGHGARAFVAGLTGRFLQSLLRETAHWQRDVRLKSLRLLPVLIILCGETLVQNAHLLLDALMAVFADALGGSTSASGASASTLVSASTSILILSAAGSSGGATYSSPLRGDMELLAAAAKSLELLGMCVPPDLCVSHCIGLLDRAAQTLSPRAILLALSLLLLRAKTSYVLRELPNIVAIAMRGNADESWPDDAHKAALDLFALFLHVHSPAVPDDPLQTSILAAAVGGSGHGREAATMELTAWQVLLQGLLAGPGAIAGSAEIVDVLAVAAWEAKSADICAIVRVALLTLAAPAVTTTSTQRARAVALLPRLSALTGRFRGQPLAAFLHHFLAQILRDCYIRNTEVFGAAVPSSFCEGKESAGLETGQSYALDAFWSASSAQSLLLRQLLRLLPVVPGQPRLGVLSMHYLRSISASLLEQVDRRESSRDSLQLMLSMHLGLEEEVLDGVSDQELEVLTETDVVEYLSTWSSSRLLHLSPALHEQRVRLIQKLLLRLQPSSDDCDAAEDPVTPSAILVPQRWLLSSACAQLLVQLTTPSVATVTVSTLSLARRLLSCIRSAGGVGRIVSFEDSDAKLPIVSEAKLLVRGCLGGLQSLLYSSDQAVRDANLTLLLAAAPLLLPEDYESLLRCLLAHYGAEIALACREADSERNYLDCLDEVLRVLAVLDHARFESLAREEYGKGTEEEVKDRFSALISHADVLSSLKSRSKASK